MFNDYREIVNLGRFYSGFITVYLILPIFWTMDRCPNLPQILHCACPRKRLDPPLRAEGV